MKHRDEILSLIEQTIKLADKMVENLSRIDSLHTCDNIDDAWNAIIDEVLPSLRAELGRVEDMASGGRTRVVEHYGVFGRVVV